MICELIRMVSEEIKQYLNQNPQFTKHSLGRHMGLSPSSFTRLYEGDNSSQKNISVAVFYLYGYTEGLKILSKYYPESYPSNYTEANLTMKGKTDIFKRNPLLIQVFFTVIALKKCTKTELEEKFGKRSLNEADKLVRYELFNYSDNTYSPQAPLSKTFSLPLQMQIELTESALFDFNQDNIGSVGGFSTRTEGLKHSAITDIKRVLNTALRQVDGIICDPENQGEVPWYFCGFFNTLDGSTFKSDANIKDKNEE